MRVITPGAGIAGLSLALGLRQHDLARYVVERSPRLRDGETRIIGTGEVILIEDMHGKGHLSQAVEGKFRHSILVPVD